MSNQAYLYNAPAGVPGTVTRLQDSVVEPVLLGAAFSAFGVPFKFNGSGKAIPIAASDAATVFKGILTRSVPSISGNTTETFAGGIPNQEASQGGLRRGFVNVLCTIGTPVKGGIVYMRVVADTGKAVGDLEATADGSNNVALTGVEWAVNGKDADNITELYIK
jgi:hypothetical protein